MALPVFYQYIVVTIYQSKLTIMVICLAHKITYLNCVLVIVLEYAKNFVTVER